jgi:voltage-gated potassium channel
MLLLLVRVFGGDRRRHVLILLTAAVGCALGGAALFSYTDNIGFGSAIYWAITTATTVGYGDITPHNGASQVVASATMLTTIPLLAGVFALVTGAAAAQGIRRILAMEHRFPAGSYRLVVGLDPTVHAILDELVRAGDPVVLVADVDPAHIRPEVHVVRGDPTHATALRAAKPEGAQQVLITGGDDGDVLVSAVLMRKQAPNVPATALVRSASVREALRDLGINQTVSTDELIAHTLAKSLEAPHAGDMLNELVESNSHKLTEIEAGQAAVGKPLSAVRGEQAGLVLGLVHDGKFSLGVGEDPVISAGDRLLIAEQNSRAPARSR